MSYTLGSLLLLMTNVPKFWNFLFFVKKWNIGEDEFLLFLSILHKKETEWKF